MMRRICLKTGLQIWLITIKFNESTEAADIGYCMGKAWWGKAIMPEALGAVIVKDDVVISKCLTGSGALLLA